MDYIKAGLDAQAATAVLKLCRTCGFTHEGNPEACPRWEAPLFEGLTLGEWDQLCTRMERAMARARGGVREDCAAVHGDLMLTWHGLAELELRLAAND